MPPIVEARSLKNPQSFFLSSPSHGNLKVLGKGNLTLFLSLWWFYVLLLLVSIDMFITSLDAWVVINGVKSLDS